MNMILVMASGSEEYLSKQGDFCVCYYLYRYIFRIAAS